MSAITDSWKLFTPTEKRNIAIYICGIMLYKFGLEAFNGSITALATNRYDYDYRGRTDTITFQRVGLLQGLNQACQCIGSILIAPLIKVNYIHRIHLPSEANLEQALPDTSRPLSRSRVLRPPHRCPSDRRRRNWR